MNSDDVAPTTRKAMGGAEVEADAAGKRSGDKFGKAFNTAALVTMGAVVAKKAISVIGASIGNASDLQEAGTAVETIFGTSYGSIQKWSEGADRALGQSTVQALNAAKTFGVFGQAAGLSTKGNAEFSRGLTGLATDMASFHNTSPEQAIEAIGAALRGEMEPIRSYGVLLDDATLKAEAMAMGIYSGTAPLNAQQKVLAAQSAIFKSTTVAQGDFAKTSEGAANQARILAAQTTNLSASFGQALIPTLQTLASVVIPILSWINKTPGAVQALSIVIGVVLVAAFTAWASTIWATNAALLANPITWVVLAVVALIAGIVLLATKTQFFQQLWSNMCLVATQVWISFSGWIAAAWDTAMAAIGTGITNAGGWITSTVGAWWDSFAGFFGFAGGGWDGFVQTFKTGINIMITGVNLLLDGLSKITGGALGNIEIPKLPGGFDIPGLATGGTVTRSGSTLVGERGPEILRLPRASQVIPLDHPAANTDSGKGRTVNLSIVNPVSEPTSKTVSSAHNLVGAALGV
ncbi:hypothetical protein [Cryobacterium sp. PH31-O1]|uniref:hypothetical protein n=1 Tax=Cryobacterium sp. PH31-O1 TaxID=3046306 RepID=UPI0024B8A16F|nr:hypothetical protein [Cryobacterium sp. PH31-O1]MDJ0338267.1 hypothetical protein [Cryobacterium sp. PH31-O1]